MTTETRLVPTPYQHFGSLYLAGEWRPGRSTQHVIHVTNPYSGDQLAEIPGASVEDVNEAFTAAVEAQRPWAELLPRERAEYLLAAAQIFTARFDELKSWVIREAGATHFWADQICRHAAVCCSEAAAYAQGAAGVILPSLIRNQSSHVYRKPVGVIAVVTSWNSPINLTIRALAPALALGNAVVLKPASETPVSGALLHAKVFEEVGLPKGLFSTVIGSSEEIGNALTGHPSSGSVSFTGSTRVGRSIIAQNAKNSSIKRLGLELGGNAPLVVLDDADLDAATNAIIFGRFLHQGQICMSTNRVLAHAKIYDELVSRLEYRVRALPFGDPSDPKTVVGPLMSQKAVQSAVAKIDKAKAEGSRLVVGGLVVGNVVPPHLFADVLRDHSIWRDEIFAPVLPVSKIRDDAEALDWANDTEYGLASAVFTRDAERGNRFAHGIRAGMTSINDQTVLTDIYGPFGGEKNSGFGHFNGEWIIEEFTRPHWITTQHARREYSFQ